MARSEPKNLRILSYSFFFFFCCYHLSACIKNRAFSVELTTAKCKTRQIELNLNVNALRLLDSIKQPTVCFTTWFETSPTHDLEETIGQGHWQGAQSRCVSNQSPSQTPTEEKVDQARKRKMPKVVSFLVSVLVVVQAGVPNLLSSLHKKVSTLPSWCNYESYL